MIFWYNCRMNISINTERCIGCGRCAQVCSLGVVTMKEGKPIVSNLQKCMQCHHCYAACPVGALSYDELDVGKTMPKGLPSADDILNLLEHRYSCREYTSKIASKEQLSYLERALDMAPTGCNARDTRYIILDSEAKVADFRKQVAENLLKIDPEIVKAEPFLRTITIMLKRGMDPILRGAPHIVISAYGPNSATGEIDCVIGLSHFEMMAQALGLGTCWCGFVPLVVAKHWKELPSYLGLPEGYTIGYSMLFGEKAFDYARPVR